jgi:hypothetical protein
MVCGGRNGGGEVPCLSQLVVVVTASWGSPLQSRSQLLVPGVAFLHLHFSNVCVCLVCVGVCRGGGARTRPLRPPTQEAEALAAKKRCVHCAVVRGLENVCVRFGAAHVVVLLLHVVHCVWYTQRVRASGGAHPALELN